MLGIALHAALWGWCARRALSVGALPLFGVVVAVAIDGMFGYSLRQPVYWLGFTLVLLLTERREQYAVPAAPPDLARATGPQVNPGPVTPMATWLDLWTEKLVEFIAAIPRGSTLRPKGTEQ